MSTDAKKLPDNVVEMPDIYDEKFPILESGEEVIELSSADEEEPEGFNPYDTARLYKK
jgi:hypothetical protein